MFQLKVWMPSDVSERVGRKIFFGAFHLFERDQLFRPPR